MSFHKDNLAGFLARISEASILERNIDGDLDPGNLGDTQVVSSLRCPRFLIR